MVAVTLLSELQKGQENATSSFDLIFLGGGFDDFLLPMVHTNEAGQDSNAVRRSQRGDKDKSVKRYTSGCLQG